MRNLLNPTSPQARAHTNSYSVWFVLVAALFVTCLITANMIAVKLVSLGDLILPAAIITFPCKRGLRSKRPASPKAKKKERRRR